MQPRNRDELLDRARIGGRFAFALVGFGCGLGLLALLDRIGLPEGLIRVFAVFFVLTGLVLIAVLLRTMRISRFYAAGRSVPAPYAGLALAGLTAALFLPFIPPVPGGTSLGSLVAGFGCGLACAALVSGPLLRKTGAFSIPDLISARFPHLALRLGTVLLAAAVGALIALAGCEIAVRAFVAVGIGSRPVGAAIVVCVLILLVVPGGVAGCVWAAASAAVVLLTLLGLPLLLALAGGAPLVLPVVGDSELWRHALARFEVWRLLPQQTNGVDLILVAAMTLGIGALAPLLSPSIASRSRGEAQRAGFIALLWSFVILGLAAATMTLAAVTLDATLIGHRPDGLPDHVYASSAQGHVSICGQSVADRAAARSACAGRGGFAGVLRAEDISATGEYLSTSLPQLRNYGSALSGLISAAMIGLGLILAAAGIQSFATVLGHDAIYRVRDRSALTSRRLAISRGLGIALTVAACALVGFVRLDPRTLIGLALSLSASAFAPLLALTLWPKAGSRDAMVTLLVGLLSVESFVLIGPQTPGLERFAASAIIACALGLLAGILTSLLSGGAEAGGKLFVQAVLHQESELLHPDKGA